MNEQYAENLARTNPTRYRMTCDPGGRVLPCSNCKHRHGIEATCDAYPDGISIEVLIAVDNNKEYECAPGIKFTAFSEAEMPCNTT